MSGDFKGPANTPGCRTYYGDRELQMVQAGSDMVCEATSSQQPGELRAPCGCKPPGHRLVRTLTPASPDTYEMRHPASRADDALPPGCMSWYTPLQSWTLSPLPESLPGFPKGAGEAVAQVGAPKVGPSGAGAVSSPTAPAAAAGRPQQRAGSISPVDSKGPGKKDSPGTSNVKEARATQPSTSEPGATSAGGSSTTGQAGSSSTTSSAAPSPEPSQGGTLQGAAAGAGGGDAEEAPKGGKSKKSRTKSKDSKAGTTEPQSAATSTAGAPVQGDSVAADPGQQEVGPRQDVAAPNQELQQQEAQAPVLAPALAAVPEEGPQPQTHSHSSTQAIEARVQEPEPAAAVAAAPGGSQVLEAPPLTQAEASVDTQPSSEHSPRQPVAQDATQVESSTAQASSSGASVTSVPDAPAQGVLASVSASVPPEAGEPQRVSQSPPSQAHEGSQPEAPHATAHVSIPPALGDTPPSSNQVMDKSSSLSSAQVTQDAAPPTTQPTSTVASSGNRGAAHSMLPAQDGTVQLSVPADQAVAALLALVGQEPGSAARALAGLCRLVPGAAAVQALASLLPPAHALEPLIRSLPASAAASTLAQVADNSSAAAAQAAYGAGSSSAIVEFSSTQGFVRVVVPQ
jgi:hypothetical protein